MERIYRLNLDLFLTNKAIIFLDSTKKIGASAFENILVPQSMDSVLVLCLFYEKFKEHFEQESR